METREKNTKERILEEALKLFSQSGYMGTSMTDIAAELGVTKAALYKHYKSKQEILESIVERMNQMDAERAKKYEMPEGNMAEVIAEVIAGYKDTALDKIKQYTKVQFLHWTEEEFPCRFLKMLTQSSTAIRTWQNFTRTILQKVRWLTSKKYLRDLQKMIKMQDS